MFDLCAIYKGSGVIKNLSMECRMSQNFNGTVIFMFLLRDSFAA